MSTLVTLIAWLFGTDPGDGSTNEGDSIFVPAGG